MNGIALFDLDHTLLPIDSDHEWGRYLVKRGVVDGNHYAQENERFYQDYQAGRLDIYAFLEFALQPLANHTRAQLANWHADFMQEVIQPALRDSARQLVEQHQSAGHICAVVTATNSFVTRPIAHAFGVEHLIATEPATENNDPNARFTGQVAGLPNFREGKVIRVENWLASLNLTWATVGETWFYSDSMNDLPLLEKVQNPIATNPDQRLRAESIRRGWKILDLFA